MRRAILLLPILLGSVFFALAEGLASSPARVVAEDRAAAASFEAAIRKLDPMVRSKAGRPEEEMLTMKLVETYAKLVSVRFRLAHAPGAGGAEREALKRALESTQAWASTYVKKFPRGPSVARAIFLRAKARGDAKNEEASIADYRHLIDHFEPGPDHVSAHLALHDLLVRKQEFRTAIAYLKKLKAEPPDPHYPIVLDHLAFAHYSLNEIPQALRYLERELALFPEGPDLGPTGQAEREKIFGNIALYYFTGIEKKLPGYALAGYLPFLERLAPGGAFPKALGLFAALLRTKGWDAELEGFLRQVFHAPIPPVAQLEVALSAFESQLAKRRWSELKTSIQVIAGLSAKVEDERSRSKAAQLMTSGVETLAKAFTSSEGRPERPEITSALLACYDIVLRSTRDPKAQVQVRYNIAEVYSAVGDLPTATMRYRAVLELADQVRGEERALVRKAAFAALSSRYEILMKRSAFPRELKPRPSQGSEARPLPSDLSEWMVWVEEAPRFGVGAEPAYATFRFEADRVRYASGRVGEALQRMHREVLAEPQGKYAVPMASLVIDTALVGKEWLEAFNKATEYSKVLPSSEGALHARLKEVAADAYFRLAQELYEKKDFQEVLKRVERMTQVYPQSQRMADAWLLGANAALASGDRLKALEWFRLKVRRAPDPGVEVQMALTAASLAEEGYRLGDAARELRKVLQAGAAAQEKAGVSAGDLQRKTLLYGWLSADARLLGELVQDKHVCAGPMVFECEQFSIYLAVQQRQRWRGRPSAFGHWANGVLALDEMKIKELEPLREELERTTQLWLKVDARFRLPLLSRMNAAIPKNLLRLGQLVERSARVSLDKKAIGRRTQLIEKTAETLDKVSAAGIPGIQIAALQAWAELYSGLSRSLRSLPKPNGLTAEDAQVMDAMIVEMTEPFLAKAREVRARALDRLEKEPVEAALAAVIWKSSRSDVSEGGRAPTAEEPSFGEPAPLPAALWQWVLPPQVEARFREAVLEAGRNGFVPMLSFLTQDGKEKGYLDETTQQALKGLIFLVAGARTEGVEALGWVAQKLNGLARAACMAQLAQAYLANRSRENARTWLDLLASTTSSAERAKALSPAQIKELSLGHRWVGGKGP